MYATRDQARRSATCWTPGQATHLRHCPEPVPLGLSVGTSDAPPVHVLGNHPSACGLLGEVPKVLVAGAGVQHGADGLGCVSRRIHLRVPPCLSTAAHIGFRKEYAPGKRHRQHCLCSFGSCSGYASHGSFTAWEENQRQDLSFARPSPCRKRYGTRCQHTASTTE